MCNLHLLTKAVLPVVYLHFVVYIRHLRRGPMRWRQDFNFEKLKSLEGRFFIQSYGGKGQVHLGRDSDNGNQRGA